MGNEKDKDFNKRIEKVCKYYGYESRLFKLMEECGELIQASSKFIRSRGKGKRIEYTSLGKKQAKEKLAGEIADVMLHILEVCKCCDIDLKDVKKKMNEELEKQESRMKKK